MALYAAGHAQNMGMPIINLGAEYIYNGNKKIALFKMLGTVCRSHTQNVQISEMRSKREGLKLMTGKLKMLNWFEQGNIPGRETTQETHVSHFH